MGVVRLDDPRRKAVRCKAQLIALGAWPRRRIEVNGEERGGTAAVCGLLHGWRTVRVSSDTAGPYRGSWTHV